MNIEEKFRDSTKCVHIGTDPDPTWGSIVTPIYQTTTYAIPNISELIERGTGIRKQATHTPVQGTPRREQPR